jgi:DNA polymerase III alpha subunit
VGFFRICWNAEIHEGIETNVFPDLIAMNALYRPGIAYIPSFVKGKMGKRRLFMTLRPVKNY